MVNKISVNRKTHKSLDQTYSLTKYTQPQGHTHTGINTMHQEGEGAREKRVPTFNCY